MSTEQPLVQSVAHQTTKTKCCKSGWRMCKDGKWKLLIPRGRPQRLIDVDPVTGQETTRLRFIPPTVGPPCYWVTQQQLQQMRNRRFNKGRNIQNDSSPAQMCNQCNSIAIDADVCPKCQTVLIITNSDGSD